MIELKFNTKTSQIINNQLSLGNLSFDWTKDESKKTSLYGNIYDFVVDYKAIVGTTTIYDMHQYLMTKHILNLNKNIYIYNKVEFFRMYKMKMINLLIILFGIIKTKALECVSVVNLKYMPRPKILDVNEGVGEALFYPYNVQVNKCSGSCNTLDNPMAKLCVPNVIKGVNMQAYNFLMRLNETRNVLWHESCKCVCKLNSSVCNNKQIWNDDTCRCDCDEDFAGMINCAKGYTWNPSTCECQSHTWCKPGQYLDHKNCVCKNKLIGRVTEECTSVIIETMINNKDNITNNNTYLILFIVFLIGFIVFLIGFIYYYRHNNANKKN